ncbi:hypothetical protein DSUL_20182 [Desulfovibrionales bacterium]
MTYIFTDYSIIICIQDELQRANCKTLEHEFLQKKTPLQRQLRLQCPQPSLLLCKFTSCRIVTSP